MTRLQIEDLISKTEDLFEKGLISESDYQRMIRHYNQLLDNLPAPTINTNTEAHEENKNNNLLK